MTTRYWKPKPHPGSPVLVFEGIPDGALDVSCGGLCEVCGHARQITWTDWEKRTYGHGDVSHAMPMLTIEIDERTREIVVRDSEQREQSRHAWTGID